MFRAGGGRHLYLYPERDRAPRRGSDLHTSIDIVIQQIAEEALETLDARFAPESCCAIVMDPRNGEILALAGRPLFDPQAGTHLRRVGAPAHPAAQSAYPIGSVMKPLVMAAALSRGAVHPQQSFDCGRGHKRFGGRLLHDVKPNGVLDLEHILIKSSNIGMAQIGLALGIDDTYGYLRSFGLGTASGIEITGEQPGGLTPLDEWSENYTLVSVSMGRELMVTPVQLLAAYGALLNDGELLRPTLLRGAGARVAGRVDLTPEAIAFVRAAMEKVVLEGTGRRARIGGLRVAGKSGTSKIELRNKKPKYVSSFVGFAPAEDPEMLVLVVTDDPKAADGLKPYGAPSPRLLCGRSSAADCPCCATAQRPPSPGSGKGNMQKERCVLRRSIGLA